MIMVLELAENNFNDSSFKFTLELNKEITSL